MKLNHKHTKKKAQHYVPRFYLQYFIDKNKFDYEQDFLWIFERPKKIPFRKSPKNIAFVNYFYSFQLENKYNYVIEDMISKIENDVQNIFKEIINDTADFTKDINREILSTFICLMNYRTIKSKEVFKIFFQNYIKSKFIENINNDGFKIKYKRYLQETGKEELEVPTGSEFVNVFNKLEITTTQEDRLKMMLEMTKKMIPYVYQRNWTLLIPKEDNRFFITSDNPVLFYNKNINNQNYMPGYAVSDTDIIFPISPKHCLYISYNTKEVIQKILTCNVISLNQKIANNCHKYVFSNIDKYNILFSH